MDGAGSPKSWLLREVPALEQTLNQTTANVRSEPEVPNAAVCSNVRFDFICTEVFQPIVCGSDHTTFRGW